ncbi:MAG: methylmalonyl-CoA mutase family protein, partial [Rhodospirillaceae bacterium]
QWSLRLQQIVAFETDLLEFEDLFDGSTAVTAKVETLKAQAREELARLEEMGGAVSAVESGYMKRKLVESNAARIGAIEAGEQVVVGVNKYVEAEDSPLGTGSGAIMTVDPKAEQEQIEALQAWRAERDGAKADAALADLRAAAQEGRNVMEPSIACAHAGVTTGEWAQCLREIYGEYRAPTGVGRSMSTQTAGSLAEVRDRVEALSGQLGRRVKILVGKPGLDGHSNGAEQIAVRARDSGMEVVYEGIRLTPAQIVNAALEESVHVVGLSILSGSHVPLVTEVLERMRADGLTDVPVVVGGIIPPEDEQTLLAAGVARVYTPKDFDITAIMSDIVAILEADSRRAA